MECRDSDRGGDGGKDRPPSARFLRGSLRRVSRGGDGSCEGSKRGGGFFDVCVTEVPRERSDGELRRVLLVNGSRGNLEREKRGVPLYLGSVSGESFWDHQVACTFVPQLQFRCMASSGCGLSSWKERGVP